LGCYRHSLQLSLAKALAQIGDRSALPALEAIDPGPVTQSDRVFARDDAAEGMYLQTWQEIHEAVIALKRRAGAKSFGIVLRR
jgi:hypothetical protein